MPGFEPKTKVDLDPPKDDPISQDYLAKCDGKNEGYPTYVAIKVSRLVPFAIRSMLARHANSIRCSLYSYFPSVGDCAMLEICGSLGEQWGEQSIPYRKTENAGHSHD